MALKSNDVCYSPLCTLAESFSAHFKCEQASFENYVLASKLVNYKDSICCKQLYEITIHFSGLPF